MKANGLGIALGLLLVSTPSLAADDALEASYAYRAPLPVVAGAPLQRIGVPPQVLVRLQEADQADLRIFNAQGQALPMALLPLQSSPSERRMVDLKPLPVLGAPGSLTVTGVSLRVDDGGQARVIGLSGAPGSATTEVLGVLLDTRAVADFASGLTLSADIPAQQPVTFSLDSSADLSRWAPVTEVVAYRSPDDAAKVFLPLDRVSVKGRYLRVTWGSSTRLLAPVTVRGASLTTERSAAAKVNRAEITGAKLTGSHVLEFGLPFATPVTALQLTLAGQNAILPVRILGRENSEQSWTLLGSGTVYRMQGAAETKTGPAIPLNAGRFRFIQIEADKRTTGFSAPPRIQVQFEPREVAVLLTGAPPYTIAAGLKGAKANYLPLDNLMAASPGLRAVDLPHMEASPSIPVVASMTDGGGAYSTKTLILWAVLLGATAILGLIAWLAARKPEKA
ncbi:MAG: hypothetical protein CFE28_06145 [Alphaproteobacteria bacterium PA2]|nr:MAG: hypothetical protein CFE28_06145 [Alphaproteobacteria bacterium PA2]